MISDKEVAAPQFPMIEADWEVVRIAKELHGLLMERERVLEPDELRTMENALDVLNRLPVSTLGAGVQFGVSLGVLPDRASITVRITGGEFEIEALIPEDEEYQQEEALPRGRWRIQLGGYAERSFLDIRTVPDAFRTYLKVAGDLHIRDFSSYLEV